MSRFGFPCSLVLAVLSPFSLLALQPAQSATKPDYSQEAYVFEQITTKWIFENDGTSTRDTTVRLRVQSDAGVQHWGLLRFPYESSNETLDFPYVRVVKRDGTTVPTPPDSFQDMAADVAREAPFYTDLREKHIAVKGLEAGDLIEYEYQKHVTKPLAPGQFWLAYEFTHEGIVLAERLEISVPRERGIKYKSPKVTPVTSDQGRYRTYSWITSNLHVEAKDDQKIAVKAARGRLDNPDVLLSSFLSWEEVGKWYGSLQVDRIKPTSEIQAKAADLTKGLITNDAKIRAIYNYVSTDFHYIGIAFGIGRYQPHSAGEVLANRYGDCKDKHTLLTSLLTAAGIKVFPALISATYEIDPDVPSPGQFDHLIGAVPQGGTLLWLDTTTEVAPAGYLIGPLRDKHALLIADDRPAALVLTPADPAFPQTQEVKITGKLSDNDVFDARFNRLERGDSAVLLRALFRKVPESQWKDLAQTISYASGFGGTVSDPSAGVLTAVDDPFNISYAYSRKDYGGDWANHRITPPLPLILLPRLKDDEEKPKEPLWLGSPQTIHSESRMQLPKGFTPELPRNTEVKRAFAEYRCSYSFQDGTLIAIMDLVTRQHEVPIDQYGDYQTLLKAIEDDRNQYIQLSTHTSSSLENTRNKIMSEVWRLPDSKDPNALKYESEAREAFQGGDPTRAIEDLKNAVTSDPKFLRDWLLLGSTYEGTRQPDKAEEAFRGAISADPTQPLGYKMLGVALTLQGKYESAVNAWQDLMKADPNDGDGPSNLATAFYRLKRYKEAAAAYESALKILPATAGLETGLGTAYLRAGDDDAATIAFSKALELDNSPESKNDIAYELADSDKKVSLAFDYAKQAVDSLEEQSRKVDIASLKADDLRPTQALGAYWDTLGWVYYKMDNLPRAENYLLAAWSLSQDPVAADHLGQVYEKQRKTSAAMHMYRLALAANLRFDEANQHLAKLHGSTADHDQITAGSELSTMRTVKLPRFSSLTGSSEVFVLVSRDKIEDVLFISGSEKFKPNKSMFPPTGFHAQFPADSSAFLLRRGILSCFSYTGCSLVVYTPATVHSIH